MKAISNIISRFKAALKRRFRKAEALHALNEHEQMLSLVVKAENAIYKSIVTQLKNDPHLPVYGAEVRLLHRRLAQYERMRNHASLADQDKALRKLEKQWRKVEHIGNRRNHHDNNLTAFGLSTLRQAQGSGHGD